MSKVITKAIIPAAGLGIRFLPVTKTIPKEMLPIISTPTILYVVDEALKAGIEQIVLVTGRHKTAIEDFFDCSYELEDKLAKAGQLELLSQLHAYRDQIEIISVRQRKALGLGHAIGCARSVVGKEPFAVLLPDELMIEEPEQASVTKQLIQSYENSRLSAVSVTEVSHADVSKYGIVEGVHHDFSPFRVHRLIEKPRVGTTESRWAMPGRYVFSPKIFDLLLEAKPGLNGEIQLTDSMNLLCQLDGIIAVPMTGVRRFDIGDKLGFLQANIEMALGHPELGMPVKTMLREIQKRWL